MDAKTSICGRSVSESGRPSLFMIQFCADGTAESVRERLGEFGILQAMD